MASSGRSTAFGSLRLDQHPGDAHGWPIPSCAYTVAPISSAPGSSVYEQSKQLHLLVMPPWPSMLNNQQGSGFESNFVQATQPRQPLSVGVLPKPVSDKSKRSVTTLRKTLTDQDRKRMCQYAEEHPGSKQAEIGTVFGVERSTVSKVLRQKEKYLNQEVGNSPVKRPKGRSPDIERALSIWAMKQVEKGSPLTDELIRDRARAFGATTTASESHVALSASWIKRFKLKNNLLGARSREASLATDDPETGSNAVSSTQTPNGTSPTSPPRLSPSAFDLHSQQSHGSLKTESPDSHPDYSSRHAIDHSQSTTSLHSAFTDRAPSSSWSVPLSPTPPCIALEPGMAPSSFVPCLAGRPVLPENTGNASHRPGFETLQQLDYFVTSSSEPPAPKYAAAPVLEPPMEESSDAMVSIAATMNAVQPVGRVRIVSRFEAMPSPPVPTHDLRQDKRDSNPPPPSLEEVRQAFQVVLSFFEQQPSGSLDLQESITIGKLMEKLNSSSIGMNFARTFEQDRPMTERDW